MLNTSPSVGRPRTLPDAKCQKCGKAFRPHSSNKNKFCSMKCMYADRRARSAWTAKRIARARSMWNSGKTGEEIGKALGVSRNSISGIAWRHGFPARRDAGGFALAPKPLPVTQAQWMAFSSTVTPNTTLGSVDAYIESQEEQSRVAPLSPDTITVEPVHLQSPPKPRLLTRWLVTNAVLALGGGLAGAGVVIAGLVLAGYGIQ